MLFALGVILGVLLAIALFIFNAYYRQHIHTQGPFEHLLNASRIAQGAIIQTTPEPVDWEGLIHKEK